MANRRTKFLLKRSNVPGKVPSPGDLLLGELALNTSDAILYTSGTTEGSILPIGWDRVSISGDTLLGKLQYSQSYSAFTGNEIPSAQWVQDEITGTTPYKAVELIAGGVGKGSQYANDGILDETNVVTLFSSSITNRAILHTVIGSDVDLTINPRIAFIPYSTSAPVSGSSDTIYFEIEARYISVGESSSKTPDEVFTGTTVFTGGVNERQFRVVITLDASLITTFDDVSLVIKRIPSNPLDNYSGDVALSSSWWEYKELFINDFGI